MKKVLIVVFLLFTASLVFAQSHYNPSLVKFVTVPGKFDLLMMKREKGNERIKAKYFAASSYGKTVPQRYAEWSRGRKIVAVCAGTYMDNYGNPVGLTIDNGVEVNKNLANFDGLVIVYATGGIAVSNIVNKDLSMTCSGTKNVFDITNQFDRLKFISCSKTEEATVFQTHLLVYKNQLQFKSNFDYSKVDDRRERRFLAVGYDQDKNIIHSIVNIPSAQAANLKEGAQKVMDILNYNDIDDIVFVINLDTGSQDVFFAYDKSGNPFSRFSGTLDLSNSVNLLVYYYE